MNIAELREALAREEIDPDLYCLDPREMGTRTEAYRIGIHHKHWCVWFFERGIMFDEHRFASEDEACRFLLDLLRHQGGPEQPPGGGLTRLGVAVACAPGPWIPAMRALLDHLARQDFDGVPQVMGFDEDGRLLVSHVPGDGHPSAEQPVSDQALGELAQLLRRYHDATVDFVAPEPASWRQPEQPPVEVICHGDVGPHTTVFRNGHPIALVDLDSAHPGARRWDLAAAAHRFIPLGAPSNSDLVLPMDQQMIRLRLFCDAYGLEHSDREQLPETVLEWLRVRAARGDDLTWLEADIAHVEANAGHLRRAMCI
ncbi:MAG: aminoglycoside phosphotransferase family protein [Micromonosporaceae bacterium]